MTRTRSLLLARQIEAVAALEMHAHDNGIINVLVPHFRAVLGGNLANDQVRDRGRWA